MLRCVLPIDGNETTLTARRALWARATMPAPEMSGLDGAEDDSIFPPTSADIADVREMECLAACQARAWARMGLV